MDNVFVLAAIVIGYDLLKTVARRLFEPADVTKFERWHRVMTRLAEEQARGLAAIKDADTAIQKACIERDVSLAKIFGRWYVERFMGLRKGDYGYGCSSDERIDLKFEESDETASPVSGVGASKPAGDYLNDRIWDMETFETDSEPGLRKRFAPPSLTSDADDPKVD